MVTNASFAASITAAGFDIKGLKTWASRNGSGYQYTFLHNGKSAATVTNDGNGGPTVIEWMSMDWAGRLSHGVDATPAQIKKATAQYAVAKAAKDALDTFVAKAAPLPYNGLYMTVDAGWVAEELANIALMRKDLRKKTIFQVDEVEYQLKSAYDNNVAAYIKGKYPTAIILNENPAYAVAV
jgi:hypothetical protein